MDDRLENAAGERGRTGPRDRRSAVLLVGLAAALFTIAISVPHLPGSEAGSELARRFGLNNTKRGDVRLDLEVVRGGRVVGSPADRAVQAGDTLAFRYQGGGYLYLWVVEVRRGGEMIPIVPGPEAASDGYGLRAEPGGGRVVATSSVSAGEAPLVLYTLFSPVPVKLDKLRAEARRSAALSDPAKIARAIYFPGVSHVRALPRAP